MRLRHDPQNTPLVSPQMPRRPDKRTQAGGPEIAHRPVRQGNPADAKKVMEVVVMPLANVVQMHYPTVY
jgi:hypothetical protein